MGYYEIWMMPKTATHVLDSMRFAASNLDVAQRVALDWLTSLELITGGQASDLATLKKQWVETEGNFVIDSNWISVCIY